VVELPHFTWDICLAFGAFNPVLFAVQFGIYCAAYSEGDPTTRFYFYSVQVVAMYLCYRFLKQQQLLCERFQQLHNRTERLKEVLGNMFDAQIIHADTYLAAL
jgi:hypothetical protein